MNHPQFNVGTRIALSILFATISSLCAETVSRPSVETLNQSFDWFYLSDLPDQAAFYPERIACSVQKNPKSAWESVFIIKKSYYTKEEINSKSIDHVFNTLRAQADQGNSDVMHDYFYSILLKNAVDQWDVGFYRKDGRDQSPQENKKFYKKFVKEFHDISVLAMSYAYVFFSLQPAEVPVDQRISEFSKSKETEFPPAWVAEAKAAGERWKYLCAHPDERQAEIEKSDRLPLCPKYVDKNRENWEPTPKSPEEVPAWRERMGFGEDKPAPQVLQGCLPRPPEAPEIHIARPL